MSKTVFLSSTGKDLAEHREAVFHAIQQMDGWKCIRMENFAARDSGPDDFCRQMAAACDIFVGIVGHLYGSSRPGSDQSFTEREYEAATRGKRPRLMFLAPDDLPIASSLRENDEKNLKLKSFRERVGTERIRASFRSADDLAAGVATALHNWERAHLACEEVAKDEGRSQSVKILRVKENVPLFLSRITSGRELLGVVTGSYASSLDHDELATDAEVDLIAGFLQAVKDWGDINADLEPADRVRAARGLTKELEELHQAGFMVFGAREVQRIEGGVGGAADWPVSILRVLRASNEDIIDLLEPEGSSQGNRQSTSPN